MKNSLSVNDVFHKVRLLDHSVKLTDLRKEVLKIIIQSNKPISATEVLQKLKKRRDSAEPPTVYRVIDYFLEREIIHKIATENKYVLCSQLGLNNAVANLHGLIFICNKCSCSQEVTDESFSTFLKSLADNHQFMIDGSLVEVKGICNHCAEDTPATLKI